ncbi:MAG: hypothetical protein KBT72_08655 [Zhongshania sp.]|nr:hypothetical protein [Zhongshania sp.]
MKNQASDELKYLRSILKLSEHEERIAKKTRTMGQILIALCVVGGLLSGFNSFYDSRDLIDVIGQIALGAGLAYGWFQVKAAKSFKYFVGHLNIESIKERISAINP